MAPDATEAESADILNRVDHENAPRGSRFFVGAVIGAVVGGLVAGLIVVSLGDPQRIYVTEKVDTAEALGRAVADVLDNQAPATFAFRHRMPQMLTAESTGKLTAPAKTSSR